MRSIENLDNMLGTSKSKLIENLTPPPVTQKRKKEMAVPGWSGSMFSCLIG
jgi:hypothetical protein